MMERKTMSKAHSKAWMTGLVLGMVWLIVTAMSLAETTYPYVFTDGSGRVVTIQRRPERIISLAPSNTEILFAVGAGEQVVGVDSFSNFPEGVNERASVGTLRSPSYEVIVGLDPDLIIVTDITGDHGQRLLGLGYPVVHVSPENLTEIYEGILLIGSMTGHRQKAEQVVNDMQMHVDQIVNTVSGVTDEQKPTVFYEVWGDPLMTAGPGSFMHELIELAGGINIASDTGVAWPLFSLETIVERDPAVILTTFTDTVEQLLSGARPAWKGIRAVDEKRVYLMVEDEMARPGPRIVLGLAGVAKALHPDLF